MSVRAVGPVGLDRVPEFLETFLIGIAVLDDERCDALGMLQCKPVSDRRAVIHQVHGVLLRAELID